MSAIPSRTARARLRSQRPVIHCLTNEVTVGRVADALAAIGARPVMASAEAEAGDMVEQAGCLVLNLGTPTPERWRAARAAGERARARLVPVVVDPVGCGATPWRTAEARALVQAVRPDLIRGNAAEVAALAGVAVAWTRLRGVTAEGDGAGGEAERLGQLADEVARALGTVVVVTGRVNAVGDGQRRVGHTTDVPLLTDVVGGGDVLTALIGACRAVEGDSLTAALAGLTLFSEAALAAAEQARGVGSFWVHFLDMLADPEAAARAFQAPAQAASRS
jgi:hydroxyethylthiazole kinase